MPRSEWREGDEIHYKEYNLLGKESHAERADSQMERLGIIPSVRKSVLKALDIFNGKVVQISVKDSATGRVKTLWEE